MAEENHTMKNEFILTGFIDHPKLKTLLFVVFFAIYLITMVGNIGMVALIFTHRRLQTPMYIFLGNLAFVDSCCACAITPKMLENFFSEDKRISLYECAVQFYFLCTVETADCFLLAAMAYDRYVAICSPLQYHTMMSRKLCIQMTTGAFIAGNLHSMIHVGLVFRLVFCGSNHINHFYCDILPLYRLSRVDPYTNELVLFIFSGSVQVFTIERSGMAEENHTMKNEFILTGFTDHPELKTLLFVVFFAIYLITMVGNIGMVALIFTHRRLHTPMYIFLGNLALVDSCCACAITPKMLENFFSEDKRISLYECTVQFYFLCTVETADCFLLAAMAYDRYVAICSPLQYHTMMSRKLCIQMTTGAFIAGNLHSMIHVGLVFRLVFCGSNHINHFYCDILPLYRLSCVDPFINELVLFIFSGSI
ncbi:hypothetical protein H8959_020654, partial [Pygathrix nigripes]